MPVRSTMASLIAKVRQMIFDPSGSNQFFADQDIQDHLDYHREDIRYEPLEIAPSIVNAASTGNQAQVIFADYYSRYQNWEDDVVLQGVNTSTHAAWVVLTPVASENLLGHWQFETSVFTSGVAPGQYPPCFATGKIFDTFAASADLLEFWSASLAGAYDITMDGQSMRRSQHMQAKLTLAASYRRKCKPKIAKLVRDDVNPEMNARKMRLLDNSDTVKGY